MSERPGAVTFKGNPMTLAGQPVNAGDAAPDVRLIANDLSEKKLSDYRGKTVIFSAVPSLDTGICDKETRTFNEKAAALGDDTVVVTVSRDLPFAQKRWCAAAGIDRVETLSDYKYHDVGDKFGVLVKELAVLARCIFIIDEAGKIKYVQLVKEIATEPDYDAVLAAAKAAD